MAGWSISLRRSPKSSPRSRRPTCRPASCSICTWTASSSSTGRSTPLSRSHPNGPAPRHSRSTRLAPAGEMSARSGVSRSRSRMRSPRRASARPAAPPNCVITFPRSMPRWSTPFDGPERWCSARPTSRAGRATTRATTSCSAPPTTRGTSSARRAVRRVGRQRRSPWGSPRSRSAPTSAVRSACPSSFCGVYGHKPSFGIIPTYGYLDNPSFHRNVADVNVFGPLARSVDDLELLLDLLAGAQSGRRRRMAARSAAGARHGARRLPCGRLARRRVLPDR